MIIKLHPKCPEIALPLEETLNNIENKDNVILGIQLSYRENNTIFELKKIKQICFHEYYIQITTNHNNTCFLDYNEIHEYFITNTDALEPGEEYV